MRWPKQIPENRFLHRSLLYFRIQIQLMPHRLTILNRWKRETGEDDHTLEERQSRTCPGRWLLFDTITELNRLDWRWHLKTRTEIYQLDLEEEVAGGRSAVLSPDGSSCWHGVGMPRYPSTLDPPSFKTTTTKTRTQRLRTVNHIPSR